MRVVNLKVESGYDRVVSIDMQQRWSTSRADPNDLPEDAYQALVEWLSGRAGGDQ